MEAKKWTHAAVLRELNRPLEIVELQIPALRPGQVLVELAYSGVCHTQLSEVRGRRGPDRFLPHTLGHEGAGIVMEIGPQVKKVRRGDRVVLSWIKGSGMEVPSQKYSAHFGEVNSGAISTFMYHTVTCENRLTPIPADLPLRVAALLGCAVLTGAGAIFNEAAVQPGQSVAIFGAGGIGMSALLAARACEAGGIIAVDVHRGKLQMARELGATAVIDARAHDPVQEIRRLTGGAGADFAIEAAGLQATMEQAFQSIRRQGGRCILAGNLPLGGKISIDPFELICGKQICGTWGGGAVPDRDIPGYAALFLSGKMPIDRLLTHTFPLAEINRAFDMLERGQVGRALIDFTH